MLKPPIKPGAVSKELGVTTVTLRHYVKEFRQFLSPSATTETNRRFTPEDMKTLKAASRLLREGNTYEETRLILKDYIPVEGEVFTGDETPGEQEPPPQQKPSAIQPLEYFQVFVDTLKEEHQAHLETLKAENERLQAEIDWLRLPWFIRWFRKK